MKLSFYFHSDRIEDSRLVSSLIEDTQAAIVPLDQDGLTVEVSLVDAAVQVCGELQWSRQDRADVAAAPVVALTQGLAAMAAKYQIRWSVSHEHDASVGWILADESLVSLEQELQTAIQIAHALDDMQEGEEWDGGEFVVPATLDGSEPNGDWESLLEAEESFQRFPEWDASS